MRRFLSTTPALLLLAFAVLAWTSSQSQSRIIQLGERLWPGYALHLRRPAPPPREPSPEAGPAADDDLIEGLLGDEGSDDALIGDLLEGEQVAGAPSAEDSLIADLLEGEQIAGAPSAEDSLIADLLAGEDLAEPATAAAPDAPAATMTPTVTGAVIAYRTVDNAVSGLAEWGATHIKHLLVLLLIVCGATATATRHHIALRPAERHRDDRISEALQLIANLGLAVSCLELYRLQAASGGELLNAELPLVWAAGMAVMGGLNVRNLLRPAGTAGGSIGGGLLATPLYVAMTLVAITYFLLIEHYPAGPAVFLQKLTEHAQLYMFIGLYVWVGMLLKRTTLVHRFFDVLRPWKMPPELLVAVVVAAAAIPTAYSGASGIFVIAVGAVIYHELRQAGARRQLALAATAMSGSLGVVLSPCLLVVIVAYLNPVDSQTLYSWGSWVFLLTAGLFTTAVLLTRQNPITIAPIRQALPRSLARLRALGGHAMVFAALLVAYWLLLDAHLDEHTAPMILPVVMIGLLLLERWADPSRPPVRKQVLEATNEATGHIGALLLLMGLSIALGGVFERSEIMGLFPQDLGSVWLAMSMLVVAMVVVGMTMDPYGAVILVSVTIADVAYRNGIDEAHFWMVVLVAFELGYLTPPVALNHLLTRQVVGSSEFQPGDEPTFWLRHERLLLPLTVMTIALLLVAFVPLAFGVRGGG